MARYKLQESGVYDTETGMSIPAAPGNRHWAEYQEWLAAGNTPDLQYTPEELEEQRVAVIKGIAARKITSLCPEWKQRNLLAQGMEIQNKIVQGLSMTPEEADTLVAIQTQWDVIKEIRRISDQAEVEGTDPEAIVWNV